MACGLAAWPIAVAEELTRVPLAFLGGAGVLVAGVALVLGSATAVPVTAALLGAEYAVGLVGDDRDVDLAAAAFGAALLLLTELAYWSLELRLPVVHEPGLVLRRVAVLGVVVAVSVAFAAAALGVSGVGGGGGVEVETLGVLAAIATLGLAVVFARRAR